MGIDRDRLRAFAGREARTYADRHPGSAARAASSNGFLAGVPQHWMRDWPAPFPLVIDEARGVRVRDVDGHEYVDLCLGDTGAMFGHGPEPVLRALAEAGRRGLTTMLPSADCDAAGGLLRERFGLPWWQVALSASDANRFALRAARAITGRRRVLVFDGCYHGAVEEGGVRLDDAGRTRAKPSLWGQAGDPADLAVCVPFNNLDAAQRALASGDVAAVLTEPALTNCGMVAPEPGFIEALAAAAQAAGTLFILDETHTLSTGLGGWARAHGFEPDIWVAGKAVAGGVPVGVWGFTEAVRARLEAARGALPAGHSGVGTTLAGSALQMAALRACLSEVMTAEAYAGMLDAAAGLEAAILAAARRFGLEWSVVRIGARLETVFSPAPPRDAAAMRATFDPELEAALHLGLINRGFLVTPFHNMLLAGPGLSKADVTGYRDALEDALSGLC